MLTIPFGPPVTDVHWTNTSCITMPKASVAKAKYSPPRRAVGNVRIAPASADNTIAASTLSNHGVEGCFVISKAETYAPIANMA
jgi:hypothetical protein